MLIEHVPYMHLARVICGKTHVLNAAMRASTSPGQEGPEAMWTRRAEKLCGLCLNLLTKMANGASAAYFACGLLRPGAR